MRVGISNWQGEDLSITRNQSWKMRDRTRCRMSKGTGVEKSLAGLRSRKESRDCWEARALTEHREEHGLSGGLP